MDGGVPCAPEELKTFERFTERARQVVVLAQDEARLLGHHFIGTEHLLLGLVREEEGLAARVLDSLGITLAAVREQVGELVPVGEVSATGQIPFTPRAKQTLECALREAIGMQHDYIGTEHVLLGLMRVEEGVAAQVLARLGVEPEAVRSRVIQLLSGPGRGGEHEHAVETFTSIESLAEAAESWLREGWEIRSITVQLRRTRAG